MGSRLIAMLSATACVVAAQATAQVTFYDAEGFRGSAFMVRQTTVNFSTLGFNDRAASAVVAMPEAMTTAEPTIAVARARTRRAFMKYPTDQPNR